MKSFWALAVSCLLGAVGAVGWAGTASAADASGAAQAAKPQLELTLTPLLKDGQAVALRVRERFDFAGAAPAASWVMPGQIGPLQRIDERVEQVQAHDAQGPLPLVRGEGRLIEAFNVVPRAWRAERAVHGQVTLDYVVRVSQETIPGPAFELRGEPRGLSAAGWTILLLPQDEQVYQIKLHWDLSAWGAGASTLDSLPRDALATMERLRSSFFMAGHLRRLPADGSTSQPYRSASLAESDKFDQQALLAWSATAYQRLTQFFGYPSPPPFTVMFRRNPLTQISGVAQPEALISTLSTDVSEAEVQQLQAHEMVHVFLHGLEPQSWFQEGSAMYYEDRAPFELGLISPEQYLANANATLRRYYSNVRRGMSMADAQAAFWTDARARLQVYDRGGIYFMVTEGRLRQASGGQRGLDQAIRAFLQRQREGLPVAAADWLELLKRDLGEQALADYQAMQQGGLLLPDDMALGPCFERQAVQMPVFELGFDISSLIQRPMVIRGLQADSPAARAGLKDGDRVTKSVGLDSVQMHASDPLVLQIERDGQPLAISFVPLGEPTLGYQWRRREGAWKDAVCLR